MQHDIIICLCVSFAESPLPYWYGAKVLYLIYYIGHSNSTRTERPRLSSLLVFLLSSCICFLASFLSKWIPGADGRFNAVQRHSHGGSIPYNTPKGLGTQLPDRPRRYSVPALVACIVLRLEMYNFIMQNQQCASYGLEVRELDRIFMFSLR